MKCKTQMKKERMTRFQIQDENSVQFHSIQKASVEADYVTRGFRVEHHITQ